MKSEDKASVPDSPGVADRELEPTAEPPLNAQEMEDQDKEGGDGAADAGRQMGEESEGDTQPPVRRDAVSRFVATLALFVALSAAAGSGFLFWQYRQFYVALDEADASAQGELERARANLRGLQDELDALAEEHRATRGELAGQQAEIESLPLRLTELEQRLTALQGVSADARRRWLRAETEYLLAVANTELSLGGRFENAIVALEMADAKLRELGNPRLTPVREAIADELQRLRAVPLPDVEGLSLTMGSLVSRVDRLPLAARLPDDYGPPAQEPDDVEPGLGRAWASLKSALKGMISIERRDTPVRQQLSTGAERVIRRSLELELTSARLSLLGGQGEPYRQGLESARNYLEQYFDTTDREVTSALALVDELLDMNVQPSRPDISASLNLLRDLGVEEDSGQ